MAKLSGQFATSLLHHPLLRFTMNPLLSDRLASVHQFYTLQANQRLLLVLKNKRGQAVYLPAGVPIGQVAMASMAEVKEAYQLEEQRRQPNSKEASPTELQYNQAEAVVAPWTSSIDTHVPSWTRHDTPKGRKKYNKWLQSLRKKAAQMGADRLQSQPVTLRELTTTAAAAVLSTEPKSVVTVDNNGRLVIVTTDEPVVIDSDDEQLVVNNTSDEQLVINTSINDEKLGISTDAFCMKTTVPLPALATPPGVGAASGTYMTTTVPLPDQAALPGAGAASGTAILCLDVETITDGAHSQFTQIGAVLSMGGGQTFTFSAQVGEVQRCD